MSNPITVKYGELLDVIGSPVTFNDITFLPAITSLTGSGFSGEFSFADWCHAASTRPPRIVRVKESAPWVLGRLMYLFNTANRGPDDRLEKCCLYESFVAFFPKQGNLAVPFNVFDNYGETFLYFSSENGPPIETRSQIADAFYGLLLDDPDSICNYKNRGFHSGMSEWFDFGVSHGEPYMELRNPKAIKQLADQIKRMLTPATIKSTGGDVIYEVVHVTFWYQPGTEPLQWGGTVDTDMQHGQYELLLKDGHKCMIRFGDSTRQFDGIGVPPKDWAENSKPAR
jgi:hypothetical protein